MDGRNSPPVSLISTDPNGVTYLLDVMITGMAGKRCMLCQVLLPLAFGRLPLASIFFRAFAYSRVGCQLGSHVSSDSESRIPSGHRTFFPSSENTTSSSHWPLGSRSATAMCS